MMEVAIKNDAVVKRLELRVERNLELRVFDKVDPPGVPVLTIEGSIEDEDSLERQIRFIQSTKFESLALNIRSDEDEYEYWCEDYNSVVAMALTQSCLKKIELPVDRFVDRYMPDLMGLLVEAASNSTKQMSWTELSVVNLLVEDDEYYVLDRYGIGEIPEPSIDRSIRRDIGSVSFKLATQISDILRHCQNVTSLTFCSVRIREDEASETDDEEENENVATCLAECISTTKTLRTVRFNSTRMTSEVQEILADSILNNESIKVSEICGFYGGNDLLVIMERLVANERISFEEIESYEDPAALEIFATVLENKRPVKNMSIGVCESELNRVAPHRMDRFLNALENRNTRLDWFCLDGYKALTLSKVQWASLLNAFTRSNCYDLDLRWLALPDGWELDVVDAIPVLCIKVLKFLSESRVTTDVQRYNELFLEALRKNYSLESMVLMGTKDLEGINTCRDAQFLCHLNWAGRRIERLEPYSFTRSLWPRIFARINGDGYEKKYCDIERWKYSKADTIFHFLRGPMLQAFNQDQEQADIQNDDNETFCNKRKRNEQLDNKST